MLRQHAHPLRGRARGGLGSGFQHVARAGSPAGAATYDPATDEWEEIAAPALEGRRPEAAWTGGAVVVWDSSYGGDRGWTWTPGDDEWSPLPPLPGGSRTQLGSMAWTGRDLVVWGQSTHDESLAVGARWRPGDDARSSRRSRVARSSRSSGAPASVIGGTAGGAGGPARRE